MKWRTWDARLRAIDSNRRRQKFHRGKVIVAIRRRIILATDYTDERGYKRIFYPCSSV